MNPHQEAVFIGGKQNGVRAIVDITQSVVLVQYPPSAYDELVDSIYAPDKIKVDKYALHLMMSGQFIAVHESLNLRTALELIISKYPKKRKPRQPFSQQKIFDYMQQLKMDIANGLPPSFNYTP